MIDSSVLYIASPIPGPLNSNTSYFYGSPLAGVKVNSNFPGPDVRISVALYWSPNACLPIIMGSFHEGTSLGIFLQIIGSLKTVPPK